VCVSTIGAITVAEADPVAVDELPEAAWAIDTVPNVAMIATPARTRLLKIMVPSSLREGSDVPFAGCPMHRVGKPAAMDHDR